MWLRLKGGKNVGRVVEVRDEDGEGMLSTGMGVPAERGDADDPPPAAPVAPAASAAPNEPPAQFSVAPNAQRAWSVTDTMGNALVADCPNRVAAIDLAWKLGAMSAGDREAFLAARVAATQAWERQIAEQREAAAHRPSNPVPHRGLGQERVPPIRVVGDAPSPTPAPSELRRRGPGVFFT